MGRHARGSIGTCLVLLLAARAGAQSSPCGDLSVRASEELDVRPADRAEGVARNAAVVVRHPDGADLETLLRELHGSDGDACGREPICLFRDARRDGGDARELVPGRVTQPDARTLAFVPDAPLRPSSDYFPLIARSGFDRAARSELEFRTGTGLDREPPSFDRSSDEIRIAIDAPPPECEAPRGSVRVQVGVAGARDDGDDESVELLLFVTDAAGARGPELRARRRNDPGAEVVLTFLLDAREAEQPVCVALRAIDGVGRTSEDEPARCFDPVQDSHFEPLCSAGAPGRADGRRGLLVPSSVWLWVVLRRRRRERNRSTPPSGAPP